MQVAIICQSFAAQKVSRYVLGAFRDYVTENTERSVTQILNMFALWLKSNP